MCSHLWDVIRFRNIDTLRTLLEIGEDINFRNPNYLDGTLLQFAIARRWYEIANFLIDRGADTHTKNNRGWTALHWAAVSGHLEIVQLLIAAGADVNSGLERGDTPLRVAGLWRYDAIVEFLINNGAKG
ncbi:ankyrin repeat domain-containing protein [Pseudanabaenaceae cyanobacterium LEGE 13415]|nr:ankyrin repeat domain-containing protein [Pseudanabaenaceae cyanobacterium LEGE 13415]